MGRDDTSGTIYVHEGMKDYCLKIGAANIQDYNIKVEYDDSAIPEFSLITAFSILVLISVLILVIKKRGTFQNQIAKRSQI